MPRWFGRRADEQSITRSEAFRVLRTNVEVALLDLEPASVIVTSAHPGEGKTSTCAQLARAFADAGTRVVVVDLDLRDPDLHNWFDLENVRGTSDVLAERCFLEEALHRVDIPVSGGSTRSLYVLTAGATVPNPTELLASARTARLLETLSAQADIVMIDTPPVLPVADTLVLARVAAGAILVVNDDTPVASARAAKDALVRNHARVLGVVLNRFEPRAGGYGSDFGYGETTEVPEETAAHRV